MRDYTQNEEILEILAKEICYDPEVQALAIARADQTSHYNKVSSIIAAIESDQINFV